uniref:Uncharacterized protein n=1 Tax=Arundo donax TaxID=35708 RepID=A0A0A9CNY0_ARUDO
MHWFTKVRRLRIDLGLWDRWIGVFQGALLRLGTARRRRKRWEIEEPQCSSLFNPNTKRHPNRLKSFGNEQTNWRNGMLVSL